MTETPDSDVLDPFRAAVVSVLPSDLREELERAEHDCAAGLAESDAAKDRATEFIKHQYCGRPFEHLEAELEAEYAERVRYFRAKLAKKVRWILEAWKDTPDAE